MGRERISDLLSSLGQLDHVIAAIDKDLRQQCDLTLEEYRLLLLVESEPLVQKVLACDMGRTCAAVSRWATILSRLGLVTQQSEKSARECEVSITRRGRNRLKQARARLSEQCSTLGGELTGSDRDLLERVEGNLRRFASLGSRPS
ncbi:MAG: hypothetical protein AAGF72_08060 [Pseudomonadota bacterium]